MKAKLFAALTLIAALSLPLLADRPTEVVDQLLTATTWQMPTPELGLSGTAVQLSTKAGDNWLTVINTNNPGATKTATRDNGGVRLGDDSAIYFMRAHRITFVDSGSLRRDAPKPLPVGQKGILADLGSTCDSWQPGDGLYPLPGSYLRGHYQEAPVQRGGVVTGPAYYTLTMPIVTDSHADHPGAETWNYMPGGEDGIARWAWGRGVFAAGQSDPGHGNAAFAGLIASERVVTPLVQFETVEPASLPSPTRAGMIVAVPNGRSKVRLLWADGERWKELSR